MRIKLRFFYTRWQRRASMTSTHEPEHGWLPRDRWPQRLVTESLTAISGTNFCETVNAIGSSR